MYIIFSSLNFGSNSRLVGDTVGFRISKEERTLKVSTFVQLLRRAELTTGNLNHTLCVFE